MIVLLSATYRIALTEDEELRIDREVSKKRETIYTDVKNLVHMRGRNR